MGILFRELVLLVELLVLGELLVVLLELLVDLLELLVDLLELLVVLLELLVDLEKLRVVVTSCILALIVVTLTIFIDLDGKLFVLLVLSTVAGNVNGLAKFLLVDFRPNPCAIIFALPTIGARIFAKPAKGEDSSVSWCIFFSALGGMKATFPSCTISKLFAASTLYSMCSTPFSAIVLSSKPRDQAGMTLRCNRI